MLGSVQTTELTMNTSTRAFFASADAAHASTATGPLLRPHGVVMPDRRGCAPAHTPTLQAAIAGAYQLALQDGRFQLVIRDKLSDPLAFEARAWLAAQCNMLARMRYAPLMADRDVPLEEAMDAYDRPRLPGEIGLVPVSALNNEDPHPLWSFRENLLFRWVHDWHHWAMMVGSDFYGELEVTHYCLNQAAATSQPLRQFLASEIIGQASFRLEFGTFPQQIIAANVLEML